MKRCNQCWRRLSVHAFARRRDGRRFQDCRECREKYKGWNKLSLAEKIERRGARADDPPDHRVLFVRRSGNKKLGPMPSSITERGTCPPACMFYQMGCYADAGKLKGHWRDVHERGLTWDAFLFQIYGLAPKTIWRHAEAGDLPGAGNTLDIDRLIGLARANRGRRGFTYTHKPLKTYQERQAIEHANMSGFVINLSTDSLEEADEKADLGIAPVVVTVAPDVAIPKTTPKGRKLVLCPAQRDDLPEPATCASCKLCANPRRKSIVVFTGHGQGANLIGELVLRKRAS